MSQVYSVIPNFTGGRLVKDPETGLLYSPAASVGFTLQVKKKFLEIAPKYWPDITLVCDLVGISKNAYKAHYMHDQVFREKIDSINEAITDKIEAAMSKYALEQKNFMDRIAWLRAHRGEKYNEKKIISLDVNLTKDKVDAKLSNLAQAVDTSLVSEAIDVPAAQLDKLKEPTPPPVP